MHKVVVSTLAALLLSGAFQAPSYAGDTAKEVAMFPVTMASFACGTVFGTPIAVSRKVFDDTKETCDNMCGSQNAGVKALSLIVCFPVGLFTGTLKGIYLGPKNALFNSGEHPFSKDCFSLGDLES